MVAGFTAFALTSYVQQAVLEALGQSWAAACGRVSCTLFGAVMKGRPVADARLAAVSSAKPACTKELACMQAGANACSALCVGALVSALEPFRPVLHACCRKPHLGRC